MIERADWQRLSSPVDGNPVPSVPGELSDWNSYVGHISARLSSLWDGEQTESATLQIDVNEGEPDA